MQLILALCPVGRLICVFVNWICSLPLSLSACVPLFPYIFSSAYQSSSIVCFSPPVDHPLYLTVLSFCFCVIPLKASLLVCLPPCLPAYCHPPLLSYHFECLSLNL